MKSCGDVSFMICEKHVCNCVNGALTRLLVGPPTADLRVPGPAPFSHKYVLDSRHCGLCKLMRLMALISVLALPQTHLMMLEWCVRISEGRSQHLCIDKAPAKIRGAVSLSTAVKS